MAYVQNHRTIAYLRYIRPSSTGHPDCYPQRNRPVVLRIPISYKKWLSARINASCSIKFDTNRPGTISCSAYNDSTLDKTCPISDR